MSETRNTGGVGMGVAAATRIEFVIIGIGVLALVLIFQPFSLTLFGVGCGLVVFAGLANNLLPLCQPNVRLATIGKVALIVAVLFFVVVGLAIAAAWAYGKVFIPGG
jgi:hypothetical protein